MSRTGFRPVLVKINRRLVSRVRNIKQVLQGFRTVVEKFLQPS